METTASGKRYVRRGDGLPEIGWKNEAVGYVITEERLALVLGAMGVMFAKGGCTMDWCEECNPLRKVWWDLYNESSRELRLAVASSLSEFGYQLPPGFYDEEPLP